MPDESPPGSNADQIAYWNARAAVTWVSMQERLDAVFAGLTQAALDAAAPQPGDSVLDIGCGCGATLLALAQRVGPQGMVLGLDISEPMSARARERAASLGLDQVAVIVDDAASHAFAPGTVDLLFSRFGVMCFPDPVVACANLHRAIKPNGRLLFAAWRSLAENAWFSVPMAAARALLPPQPPPVPDAPGPFAFADAARACRLLEQAGWTGVHAQRLDVALQLAGPGQLAEATAFATSIGPLARILPEVDEAARPPIRAAVADALRHHDGPDGICLGASIWIVSGDA